MTAREHRVRLLRFGALRGGPPSIVAAPLAFMLLTLAPYLYGRIATPPGQRFLWTHSLNSGDLYTYLAQINRVRQGELLARNSFTIDEPNRGLLRPTYLLLGGAAWLTGLPAIAVFHAGRILLGTLFFLALRRLAALLLEDPRERRTALVLAATSSGLGWLLRGALPSNLCPDTWQPELNVFMSLYESPHFTASLVLIVASLTLLIRAGLLAREAAGLRPAATHALGAGALAALLILDHPFDAATMAMVGVLVLVWAWRILGLPARAVLLIGLAFTASAAPAPLWLLARVRSDPVAAQWLQQNVLPSPPLAGYLVGFGLLWPLAAWGWLRRNDATTASGPKARRKEPGALAETPPAASALWLLGVWALFGFALVSLPVAYQRRLAEGWHIPVLLLAARGLGDLQRRFPPVAVAPFGLGTAILALGTAALVVQDLRLYDSGGPRAYVSSGVVEAVERLSERVSHADAVLAGPRFSYLLTGLSGCHVVAGHRIQAVVLPETARTLQEGLANRERAAEPARRLRELFTRSRLKHAVFEDPGAGPASPKVLSFGDLVLAAPPGVRPQWENDEIAIYDASEVF
jgi:hypothetical protein